MRQTSLSREDLIGSLSGALAGALTAVAVCPLDVVRTRFQVQSGFRKYAGLSSAIRLILREEGASGLYRGLGPTLIALVPNWAVYFSVYEHLKHAYAPYVNKKNHSAVHLFSAVGAGLSTVIVTNPLWVIKTRMQTQDMGLNVVWNRYKGTFDGLHKIVKYEGMSRLYSGLVPAVIGIAHVAVQFPLYEHVKEGLSQRPNRREGPLTVHELVLASSISKMVASTVTYPHEVLRSHMHLNGTKPFCGLRDTLRHIWKADGIRGFYKGCGVNLCRAVPSAAITFTSFELISRILRKLARTRRCEMKELPAS